MATPVSYAPLFTVGIPTYQRAALLPQAIQAVLHQSCADFELLISDNASTDSTPNAVAPFQRDPRVRYIRHPQNIGAIPNFNFLAQQARGQFFVLHQDDDLLHRDFLQRCATAFHSAPEIVMYASAWWRGNEREGYRSRLLSAPDDPSPDFVLSDAVKILPGPPLAISLLHSFYFAHPAIAIRTATFQKIGGYYSDPECVSDVVTEARVLLHGALAYDPRPGAIFRDHTANYSRTMPKSAKIISYQKMYRQLVADFDAASLDWIPILQRDLERYSISELLKILGDWARYSAPAPVQKIGWKILRQKNPRSTLWLVKKVLSRIGVRNLVRSAAVRSRKTSL